MNGPRRLAVAVVWLAASWCGLAGASDLSWSGPPECRQSEQLNFEVQRALGAPLADTGHVHLQVHIERVTPDARALLRIASGGDGAPGSQLKQRLLVAPDCATLVETLAVAIALAVEAAAPAAQPAESQPAAAVLAVNAASEPRRPDSAPLGVSDAAPGAEPEVAGAPLVPSVGALLVADAGSLPHAALGTGVGVQLGAARWRLELLGTYWFEQRGVVGSNGGPGAKLNLATGALFGCVDPFGASRAPVSLSLCLGWEMGRLSGTGTRVSHPRSASALWLAPSLQAVLAYRVPGSRLGLEARAGGALPLDRDEFVLEGLGTVHQPSSLAARAGLGIAVALE